MYEVRETVENSWQVADFLNRTANYGKRFYKKTYYETPNKQHYISINAIAISRELTHILHWSIECDFRPDLIQPDFEPTTQPEQGFIPTNETMTYEWFPCLETHVNYVDTFHYNGFTKVDSIKTDGVELEF